MEASLCFYLHPGFEQRAGSSLLSPQRAERLLKVSEAVELIWCVTEQTQTQQNWGWEHLGHLTSQVLGLVLGLHPLAGTGRGNSVLCTQSLTHSCALHQACTVPP